MRDFSFPTFAVVLSIEILILAGLVIARHRTNQALALSGFCASVAFYVLYRFSFPEALAGGGNWLAPLLANETLPAVLLLLFVSTALFDKPNKLVMASAALPLFEVVLRYTGLLADQLAIAFAPPTQISFAAITTKASLFAGQGALLILSAYALYLLFKHRDAYLQQTAENRLATIYLYVSPAAMVFSINLLWLCVDSLIPRDLAPPSEIFFSAILILSLTWPASYLFLPQVQYHRISPASATHSVKSNPKHTPAVETSGGDDTPEPNWVRLQNFLQSSELYLNPDLTLVHLAREFGTNRAEMSRLINKNAQDNFNNYINRYRISHAKNLLASTPASIIEIAFDSGFSSKATFNRVFRAIENCTPTDYRKNDAR